MAVDKTIDTGSCYSFQFGGGWQFASAPAITYNHDASSGNKLTVPLGVGISRTMVIKNRPWNFHLQYWNIVDRPDAFAAEHTIRFSKLLDKSTNG